MKTQFAVAILTAALSGAAFAAGSGMSEEDPMTTQGSEATGTQTYTYEGDTLNSGAGGQDMATIDLNQDQVITEDEAVGVPELANQWQDLDTNQDGQLDESEFARFEPTESESTDSTSMSAEPLEGDVEEVQPAQ